MRMGIGRLASRGSARSSGGYPTTSPGGEGPQKRFHGSGNGLLEATAGGERGSLVASARNEFPVFPPDCHREATASFRYRPHSERIVRPAWKRQECWCCHGTIRGGHCGRDGFPPRRRREPLSARGGWYALVASSRHGCRTGRLRQPVANELDAHGWSASRRCFSACDGSMPRRGRAGGSRVPRAAAPGTDGRGDARLHVKTRLRVAVPAPPGQPHRRRLHRDLTRLRLGPGRACSADM